MDHIRLYHQVLVDEFSPKCIVGHDASHLRGAEDHSLGFLGGEEGFSVRLTAKVELVKGTTDNIGVSLPFQGRGDCRSYQSQVAGDVYFGICI